jgi:hypothetical protein
MGFYEHVWVIIKPVLLRDILPVGDGPVHFCCVKMLSELLKRKRKASCTWASCNTGKLSNEKKKKKRKLANDEFQRTEMTK